MEKILEEDIESLTRYDYNPWLMDDHPLRSHPTECIPGLMPFLAEWYTTSIKNQWKAVLLRMICVVIACLAVYQFILHIPFPQKTISLYPRSLEQAQCTLQFSGSRPNTLMQAIAAGCEGGRTGIWLHGHQLHFSSDAIGENDLQMQLDLLFTNLKAQDLPKNSQVPLKEDFGTWEFTLVLDLQSPIETLYSDLVFQLHKLRQNGLLSHWDGSRIVPGRIRIVLGSDIQPKSDCSQSPYSDIFWKSEDGPLIPICGL